MSALIGSTNFVKLKIVPRNAVSWGIPVSGSSCFLAVAG